MAREFPYQTEERLVSTGCLLTSAAAAVASIVPGAEGNTDAVQPSLLTPRVPALKVCAATARRLLAIARRNEIRREAKLPLLSVLEELRRMKQQEDLVEFERFGAAHREAVWNEVLKPRREAKGNSNWRPTCLEGMYYQSQVYKILRERFYAARQPARVNSVAVAAA